MESDRVRQFRSDLLAAGFVHAGGPGQLTRTTSSASVLFVTTYMDRGHYWVAVYTRADRTTGSRVGTHKMEVADRSDLGEIRDALVEWGSGANWWPPHPAFTPDLKEM